MIEEAWAAYAELNGDGDARQAFYAALAIFYKAMQEENPRVKDELNEFAKTINDPRLKLFFNV